MKAPLKKKKLPKPMKGWETNHPSCIYCGKPARPAVLMFQDDKWVNDKKESVAYRYWKS
jgi:hypothetical protein